MPRTMTLRALSCVASLMLAMSCSLWSELPRPTMPLTPTPDAEFRRRPPSATTDELLHPPPVARAKLPNGLQILVVEDPRRPVVSVAFAGAGARALGLDADSEAFAELAVLTLTK